MAGKHYTSAAVSTITEPPAKRGRGRPKGKPSLAVALTHELINKKAESVVKKVLAIALDDKHPKQMEALKMCFDRLAPVSVFERVAEHNKTKGIEININLVGDTTSAPPSLAVAAPAVGPSVGDAVIDVEAREVKGPNEA